MTTKGTDTPLDAASLQARLGPQLTAEQAALIFQQEQEAVVFTLLTLANHLAGRQASAAAPDPSTPSSQTPPYQKPTGTGQAGDPTVIAVRRHRRSTAAKSTRSRSASRYHGPVQPCRSTRTQVIEDIPADITPVITEHVIPRYWCLGCRTAVKPVVIDALPGSTIGLQVVVLSAWLHPPAVSVASATSSGIRGRPTPFAARRMISRTRSLGRRGQ
jgi:transposase